jgi:hypothetical protein
LEKSFEKFAGVKMKLIPLRPADGRRVFGARWFENKFQKFCSESCTVKIAAVLLQPLWKQGDQNFVCSTGQIKDIYYGEFDPGSG